MIKIVLGTTIVNRSASMIFITGKWPSNLIWFSRNKSATIDFASVYKMCEGIYMSSSTCSVDNLVWGTESRIGVNWHCTLFAKMGKITNWVGHWTLWPLYSQRRFIFLTIEYFQVKLMHKILCSYRYVSTNVFDNGIKSSRNFIPIIREHKL